MAFLSTLIIAVLITALTIPLLRRLALRHNLVDLPDERKVHSQPIPRVGGAAMVLGAFVPLVYWEWQNPFLRAYLLAAVILILFGLADDLRNIAPVWKLVGQGGAAAVIILLGGVRITTLGTLMPEGGSLPVWFSILLTLVAIVGVTNAINLADGLDGLAGGIGLLCIATIAFLAWQEGDLDIALIAVALCGATFGFLRYNTYPASIFMGDTGSQLLGFSAISLSLALTQGSTPLSPTVPLLILGFPVLDTLTVMTGRMVRGRSPFSADKTHFHHSLLALGLHQTESVLVIYMIQVGLILAAYRLRFYSDWLLLGGYLLFSAGVLALFAVSRQQGWQPKRARLLTDSKLYLARLRDRSPAIKYIFRSFYLIYPALVVLITVLAGRASGALSLAALAALAALVAMLAVWLYRPSSSVALLRGIIYLLVPYSVYRSEQWLAGQLPLVTWSYRLLFLLVVLLNILVSKLTRRSAGFKSTPLDFLIFFLTVALMLPAAQSPDYYLGLVGAKIIILYYGCEVLMAELRGKPTVLMCGVAVSLALLALRWFV